MVRIPGAELYLIKEILSGLLPPYDRQDFIEWSQAVKEDDFWRGLGVFLSDVEVKNGIAEFVIYQIKYMEFALGIKVDALLTVAGTRYAFRNLYDELS